MRKLLSRAVCLVALCGTAHAQGIPVHDNANLLEQIQELAQAAKSYALAGQAYVTQQLQWAKQVQQAAVQAEQYAVETEQLLAFVHNPNLGAALALLNQAGLTSSMPASPNAVMSLVNGFNGYGAGGVPNIAGLAAALNGLVGASHVANHVYSPTDGSWNSEQLIANGNGISGTQGTALASYQNLQTHLGVMPALRSELLAAADPKDVQDAQAEIAMETLWTANQQASLSALQITAQTQDAARVQRDNESLDKGIDDFLAQAAAAGRGLQ